VEDNFNESLAHVLKHEGGFVNHPKDPGGATNLGCTKRVWEEWVGHEVTVDDIRSLTVADVTPLYKKKYWDAVRGDDLPRGVDFAVFDLAINSGTGRASKLLQRAVGVAADGAIGPATLAAVASINPRELATKVCEARLAFLQGLPTWETFGKGWGRRVKETEKVAFNMAVD
jgi:lysozyme family protein